MLKLVKELNYFLILPKSKIVAEYKNPKTPNTFYLNGKRNIVCCG